MTEPLAPEEVAEIEEWVGTPESFLLTRIFGEGKEHEARVSGSLQRLIATIRGLEAERDEWSKKAWDGLADLDDARTAIRGLEAEKEALRAKLVECRDVIHKRSEFPHEFCEEIDSLIEVK